MILEQRINAARLAGEGKRYSLEQFKTALLKIGLAKYEKSILPLEIINECVSQNGTQKIIQFPKRG